MNRDGLIGIAIIGSMLAWGAGAAIGDRINQNQHELVQRQVQKEISIQCLTRREN